MGSTVYIKMQKTYNSAKTILKKKNKVERHTSLFQNLLQNYSNEDDISFWLKNKHVDQWDRINNLEINPRFLVN